MINISFDNAYLLLIAIPLLALVLVPYFITINKDNRDKHVVASLALHLAIIMLASFAMAGTTVTAIITKTNVYVLADVSYSSSHNLDTVDEYVNTVKDELPRNSKMGVICFGANQKVNTPLGGEFETVKNHTVDVSSTDILGALNYAADLFARGDQDVIKRIVLITDGKNTDTQQTEGLANVVKGLVAQGIYVDAMYLDNNIPQGSKELQVTSVDYTKSTYINHETTADVLIQSSYDTSAFAIVRRGGEEIIRDAITLNQGFNVYNVDMPTDVAGTFDYEFEISASEAEGDRNTLNNKIGFTQAIEGDLKVLLVSGNSNDFDLLKSLYGRNAEIKNCTSRNETSAIDVPFSIEELCYYDEIVLSDINILKQVNNVTAFIENLDIVVAQFGKSLLTFGDLKIQNLSEGDEEAVELAEEKVNELERLGNMLPVKFGNADQDEKHVCLVIDISRSMETLYHLVMAKQAAINIVNLLNEQDKITIITFAGESYKEVVNGEVNTPVKRAQIIEKINKLDVLQGTFIGSGMRDAYSVIKGAPEEDRQVMLISDGRNFVNDTNDPAQIAKNMRAEGIVTSAIAIVNDSAENTDDTGSAEGRAYLQNIAKAGSGNFYAADTIEELSDVMFAKVNSDMTDTVITDYASVNVEMRNDKVLKGIDTENIEQVKGYVYSKQKATSNTVLTATYQKANGGTTQAPIYSYWEYGMGKVATFTSALSANMQGNWSEGNGLSFLNNVIATNVPEEKVDYPYTFNVQNYGTYSTVEIVPVLINPDAVAKARITLPDGEPTEPVVLNFDGSRYFYEFVTAQTGKYSIEIIYSYGTKTYENKTFFNISYSPEYDSFVTFDDDDLKFVRSSGNVFSDGTIVIENAEDEVATYTINLTAYLLIIAVVLFVADIAIRKLKWADIKSLFKKQG
ncbi:MAG: VWA domain-containing protein [Clostridiales bacterium]|nr:VWA domain-containing protein [Clostridiales bacterium]